MAMAFGKAKPAGQTARIAPPAGQRARNGPGIVNLTIGAFALGAFGALGWSVHSAIGGGPAAQPGAQATMAGAVVSAEMLDRARKLAKRHDIQPCNAYTQVELDEAARRQTGNMRRLAHSEGASRAAESARMAAYVRLGPGVRDAAMLPCIHERNMARMKTVATRMQRRRKGESARQYHQRLRMAAPEVERDLAGLGMDVTVPTYQLRQDGESENSYAARRKRFNREGRKVARRFPDELFKRRKGESPADHRQRVGLLRRRHHEAMRKAWGL